MSCFYLSKCFALYCTKIYGWCENSIQVTFIDLTIGSKSEHRLQCKYWGSFHGKLSDWRDRNKIWNSSRLWSGIAHRKVFILWKRRLSRLKQLKYILHMRKFMFYLLISETQLFPITLYFKSRQIQVVYLVLFVVTFCESGHDLRQICEVKRSSEILIKT